MPDGDEPARPLVIGLGTDGRSDDGIGLDVARALRDDVARSADVLEAPGDLSRLLDLWSGRPLVVLVDAMRSGAPPGTLARWDGGSAAAFPTATSVSTHGLSLAGIVQLAVSLGRLPSRLVVFGIEGREFGPGTARSAEVRRAEPEAVRRIAEEVRGARTGRLPAEEDSHA